MTRFAAVEALFDAVVGLPAATRERAIAEARVDADVRAEVRRLLAADARADDRVGQALDAAVGVAARAPQRLRIGAYRLLRELGSGGMGSVFLAERSLGGTRQQVALKLIRGLPTAQARHRLVRERELLAQLNHPNIARLLDGGEDEGQPWLVIEHVEGEPLLDWCARHGLNLARRLVLFERLCGAVQHAHQRLVVHRDIKPSNVVVRADGDPVLLDFGIGALLDDPEDATVATAFTPAYAAPEQRRGERATTAGDIHALGGLLRDLAAPVRAGAARGMRRDLDRVVARAMQAHPARRYASADALAADVARLRLGHPVHAAPDAVGYRARRFIARHPLGGLAAILALVVAITFVWRLAVERDRAIEQARRAEATRDLLLSVFDAAAPERLAGRTFGVRDLIALGRARLAEGSAERADLRAPLTATLARVHVALGDPAAALELLEPVRAGIAGDDREASLLRAEIDELLGRSYRDLDRVDESLAAYRRSLATREAFAASDPDPLATSLQQVGQAELEGGRAGVAEPLLARALALRSALVPADIVGVAETRRTLALVHLELGDVARARAEAATVEADLDAAVPATHPARIDALATHASILLRQGEFEAARERLERALVIARTALGETSTVTATLENRLADSLLGLGRFRDALAHNEAALRIQRAVRRDDPLAGAIAQADLGSAYATIGDYAHAHDLLATAVDAIARARPADDPETLRARSNLARVDSLRGDHATALAALAEVLERTRATRGADSERTAFELLRTAAAQVRAGRLDAAAASLDAVEPLFAGRLPADHPWRCDVHVQRGRIALARGDAARAEREFAIALDALATQPGLAYDLRLVAGVGRIEALAALDRKAEGRSAVLALAPIIERELLPQAVERRRFEAVRARLGP